MHGTPCVPFSAKPFFLGSLLLFCSDSLVFVRFFLFVLRLLAVRCLWPVVFLFLFVPCLCSLSLATCFFCLPCCAHACFASTHSLPVFLLCLSAGVPARLDRRTILAERRCLQRGFSPRLAVIGTTIRGWFHGDFQACATGTPCSVSVSVCLC